MWVVKLSEKDFWTTGNFGAVSETQHRVAPAPEGHDREGCGSKLDNLTGTAGHRADGF